MTNAMIILLEQCKLMDEGLLAGTGQFITIEDANGKRQIELPEPIHTFQGWKQLGYSVKKGEHAIARFPIWKHTEKRTAAEDGGEDKVNSKMFMKTAAFFKMSQVEKIKEVENV